MTDHPPARPLRQSWLAHDVSLTRARDWLAAVPTWVYLTALVTISVAVRVVLAQRVPGAWLFGDEITYADMARSFADSGVFEVRGVPAPGLSRVYPILISPAYAIFENQVDAYEAAKAINAVVISLVAVPVYFLARRYVARGLALLAAALALALPSMAFSTAIMSENAFYPLFATIALVLVLVLERPTARRQVLLLGLIVLGYLTRSQALALVPAYLTAILLLAFVESRSAPPRVRGRAFRRELGAFWLSWAVVGLVAAGAVGWQLVRGQPLDDLLGTYAIVATTDYSVVDTARWFVYHLVDLELAVAVVPFAAFLLLLVRACRAGVSRADRAFAFGSAALVFWFVLAVSMFVSRFTPRLEERLVFHLAVLFFVALVVWVGRARRDWTPAAAAAVLVAWVLPGAFAWDTILTSFGVGDSFGLWPLWDLRESGWTLPEVQILVAGGVLVAGLVFLLVPPRSRVVLPFLLLVVFAITSVPINERVRDVSTALLGAGIGGERTWIDQAVGPDAEVVALWSENHLAVVWENEFFNKSIGPAYSIDRYVPDGLDADLVLVGNATGFVREQNGDAIESDYVVTDAATVVEGEIVAEDPVLGTRVVRVDGPVRLLSHVRGLYPYRYSSRSLTWTRHGCPGGTLHAFLSSLTEIATRPQTVTATIDGVPAGQAVVPPGGVEVPLSVALRPGGAAVCEVQFTVDPTFAAGRLVRGDTRGLGVIFSRLEFVPGRSR